ncbi:integral membrane protein [Colletotrichum cereale]|nr:integral membrane protein [Colletotrichum cereale]
MPPDETLGPIWLVVSSSLLALLLVTTALRLLARLGRKNLGWDDYTITVAAITATIRYAFGVMQLSHGNGRHRAYLSDYDYMMLNMYGWWGQLFHFTSTAFLKVSICLLVIRIQHNRTLIFLLYTIMGGSLVINFTVVIILLAECRPAGFWRENSAQCWPNTIRIYAIWISIAYSVLSDILCSLLPLTVVWKVKITFDKKAMVIGLMWLGLVATVFGIVRAKSLSVSEADLSWDFCMTAIWSNLELFLGIAAANLALSRAIYLHFFAPYNESTSTERLGSSSQGYLHTGIRLSNCSEGPATTDRKETKRYIPLGGNIQEGIQMETKFCWKEDNSPQGPNN